MTKVHACTEIRVGVWTRTFCGLQVIQSHRGGWYLPSRKPTAVTRKDIMTVTCERCARCCD